MSDDQYDAAISLLTAIRADVEAVKRPLRDTASTIDRILVMQLPSGLSHAQA